MSYLPSYIFVYQIQKRATLLYEHKKEFICASQENHSPKLEHDLWEIIISMEITIPYGANFPLYIVVMAFMYEWTVV